VHTTDALALKLNHTLVSCSLVLTPKNFFLQRVGFDLAHLRLITCYKHISH
jgi:hypothetical protein